jgi:hypothetical protein
MTKRSAFFALAATFVGISSLNAQTPAAGSAKEELVNIKKVNVGVQKTPKIQFDGPTDKRWTPKDWLEIEVDCDILKSKKSPDPKQTTYDEVTLKFYLYLEGQDRTKSRILTGEVVHTNVPIDKDQHSVMYVTPSTIFDLTGKKEGNPASVKYWGVIATVGGNVVGYKVSSGAPGTADKPWWEMGGDKAPSKEAGLKRKSETPFAMLWADYHLDERGK